MGKTASDAVTHRVLEDFLRLGIKVNLLMIYGYPIETDEDFDQTLAWVRQHGSRVSHICFSCFVVTPEYLRKRPGVVFPAQDSGHPWEWCSSRLDLEKRKQRFLLLMEVLQGAGVDYMISSPLPT